MIRPWPAARTWSGSDSEHADHLSSPIEMGAAKIDPSFADCLAKFVEAIDFVLIHWLNMIESFTHIVM